MMGHAMEIGNAEGKRYADSYVCMGIYICEYGIRQGFGTKGALGSVLVTLDFLHLATRQAKLQR